MKSKLLFAAAIAVVAAAWGGGTASAAPTETFDPLTTNIPYLAWRGEELRLVKCVSAGVDGSDLVTLMSDSSRRFDADWLVEDWSGYPFQPPQLETSTVSFFRGNGEHRGDPCVKADFASLKAGLAIIKLVISDARTGNPVLKHQFLAGWLALNTPTIREVAAGTGTPPPPLGDPTGNGQFVAGGLPGRVQVQVTGHLPLDNNFTELGLPAAGINLPTEANGDTFWDDLARAMATTSDFRPFYRDAPWRMWDIHDDQAATEGHVGGIAQCGAAATAATVDAVDACLGAQHFIGDGEYSRVFGDRSAFPTFGPFDPLRPDETLLPDGKLDAGDVPMPSAIVEVGITPNTGAPTDIGGVGSLAIVDPANTLEPFLGVFKCIPYSRDHQCTNTGTADSPQHRLHHPTTVPNVAPGPFGPAAHNHYAPFYSRWQPATTATVDSSLSPDAATLREASGNDGPGIGNNFPGYRGEGLYDYWQFVDILSTAQDGPTRCLRRLNNGVPEFRRLPSGPQRVLVFSDEHGEAQVYFNPGLGFFFNNLVTPNANNGCDLRGIAELGHADISAFARYPYQKTTAPDTASATIRKTVGSLFNKSVSCVPKGPTPPIENSLAFICTATAIDIDGTPFANEKVCFMTAAPSEGMRAFPLGTPSTNEGLGRLCVLTNANGQASVEVFGKCGAANVIVEFVDEGIIRFTTFTFGCPPAGTPAASSSAIPPGVAPGSITPPASQAQINNAIAIANGQAPAGTTNPGVVAPNSKLAKATVAIVRIQKKAFAKKRYVMVRVNGPAKTARIQVTLLTRSGRVLSKVTRVVRTNRTVQVPNLKLPAKATVARVRVLS